MTLYKYDITTTTGDGFGTIEAANEAEARTLLEQQFVGEFIDADNKPFTNTITAINLIDITPPPQPPAA